MSARLLALDLGMSCGWAVFGPTGEREISGTWKLGKDKTRGRYGELLLRLQTAVGMNCIGAIAYEHVHHHTGIDASHVYGGWLAVLDILAHGTHVGLVPITTSEIHAIAKVSRARSPKIEGQTIAGRRKAAAERRVLNKAATLQAARDRGWPVADDNEAEACFCAVAALNKARETT